MAKRIALGIFLFIFFVIVSIPFIRITKNPPAKTYEQGLWEGANKTLKYLNGRTFVVGDTIKFNIVTLDSVLHAK